MTFTDTMPNWRGRLPRVIPILDPRPLPAPDAPHVDVHEVRHGVIADTTSTQDQSCISQLCSGDPGHTNVNGHRLHVEAVTGHAVSMSAKEFVAPGRTVTPDYVNLKIGIPKRRGQIMQQIK